MARRLCILFAVALSACGGDAAKEEACARVGAAWSLESIPEHAEPAERPEPTDQSAHPKLAVAVYHFNIQYVAGGLKGFPDGSYVQKYDLNEAEVEDRIVLQGLLPVLDLFLAHPTFKADIELQAYMVEIIALRHPEVLAKMRTLALRGQIDFDSFHYSDQLYIAYPMQDQSVSLKLTRDIFARVGLPLGRSIFTQEGQFAVGQLPLAKALAYEVSILPKNLFKYQFGDTMAQEAVFYEDADSQDHAVLLGGQSWSGVDGNGEPMEVRWTFMDDGEIAFSEDRLNPYFGLDYVVDPAEIAAHVDRLSQMEAEGYVHVTVAEAVRAMRARGVTPKPLPPVLDGTWQPKDTGNVYRWMGGPGLFRTQESDGDTLAAVWRGREAAVDLTRRLPRDASESLQAGLLATWREVLLSQVSDSTGWNPFVNEIRYARDRAALAEATARDVLLCSGLEPAAEPPSFSCRGTTKDLEALGATLMAPARAVQVGVSECEAPQGGTLYRIVLDAEKVAEVDEIFDPSEQASLEREVGLSFVWQGSPFSLMQGMDSAPVRTHDINDYSFEWIGIPLPGGLISLGSDRWVVQSHRHGRVAAVIGTSTDTRDRLSFRDETVPRSAKTSRRFYVLEGADAAQAEALSREVNLY